MSVQTSPDFLVGVDVGGTKVAVLVTGGDSLMCAHLQVPTNLHSPAHTIQGIVSAIRAALAKTRIRLEEVAAVGLGFPGWIDPLNGHVHAAVNLNLEDVPVGEVLESELGVPCFLENDVRTAALGAYAYGENWRLSNLAHMSVGTGIAAGLILNGRLYRGSRGMAGEIGHVIVDPGGQRCLCGLYGCLETQAAGPAIALRTQQALSSGQATSLPSQAPITAEMVYQAASAGDLVAKGIVAQASRYLAQAIHTLVMAYDVQKVTFGGGVSHAGEAFWQPIWSEIEILRSQSPVAHAMLSPDKFEVLPADYPSGLWGAVALARQGLEESAPRLKEVPSTYRNALSPDPPSLQISEYPNI